ncbi:FixH family protein [Advenella mimigardefordensis]|uniref:FixH family protein n=1 Tax=Advenella mimigardefordensis TaxID=302406 RepID=UPI00046D93AA|nr:FixH family protein [Advenella mimigardefordensis]
MPLQERDNGPWYREPWPWLLMAGPFAAIIGCIITIVLAFQDNPDHEVRLDARKHGLMVLREGDGPVVTAPPTASHNAPRE